MDQHQLAILIGSSRGNCHCRHRQFHLGAKAPQSDSFANASARNTIGFSRRKEKWVARKAFLQFAPSAARSLRSARSRPEARAGFADRWLTVQSRFVDDPKGSVSQADHLVNEVMETLGYPMADFEQRTADISVDHPVVVENYRAAHDIALRHGRGEATTEDLRKAMVHYRTLFEELLGDAYPLRKELRA